MPHDFLPDSDLALRAWALHFSDRISADPAAYDLSPADAADFAALTADYAARLAIARTPESRTVPAVAAKNTSRAALKNKARQLAKIVNVHPGIDNPQRADLGLSLRAPAVGRIAPPATRPLLSLDNAGRRVRIHDETSPTRRARPAGVWGAYLFIKLTDPYGPPPESIDDTRFAGLATRPRHRLPLPQNSRGKTIWVMAQWVNARGQTGPVSNAVSATITV